MIWSSKNLKCPANYMRKCYDHIQYVVVNLYRKIIKNNYWSFIQPPDVIVLDIQYSVNIVINNINIEHAFTCGIRKLNIKLISKQNRIMSRIQSTIVCRDLQLFYSWTISIILFWFKVVWIILLMRLKKVFRIWSRKTSHCMN